MSLHKFHNTPSDMVYSCALPDFNLRSSLDGGTFPTRRETLTAASVVFEDMFDTCTDDLQDQSVSLLEYSSTLINLLQMIHEPPAPWTQEAGPAAAIPIPILGGLFELAEKFQFKPRLMETLHTHLEAHVSSSPMEVYALASRLALSSIADEASRYLHRPSLAKWPDSAVKALPSAEAYHGLVRLHSHRVEKLREILLEEEIFPHGYGNCMVHGPATTKLWTRAKRNVAGRLDAGSDVGEEMREILLTSVSHCNTCGMALNRTVDMLKYKCARVPKAISRIPEDA